MTTTNNFNDDESSVIQVKRSLRNTQKKLAQAMRLIEQNPHQITSEVGIIDNLAQDSQTLISLLNNQQNNEYIEYQPQFKRSPSKYIPGESIGNEYEEKVSFSPQNKNNYQTKNKVAPNRLNLFLLIFLIASICLNIYTFSLKGVPAIESKQVNLEEQIRPETLSDDSQTLPRENLPDVGAENDNRDRNLEQKQEVTTNDQPEIIEKTPPEETNDLIDLETPTTTIPDNIDPELYQLIESKIKQISDQYSKELIKQLQINFDRNSIVIIVNSNWQKIETSKQKKLLEKLFDKSQSLDFTKFQLKDFQGNVVARNGFVGNKLIILNLES